MGQHTKQDVAPAKARPAQTDNVKKIVIVTLYFPICSTCDLAL